MMHGQAKIKYRKYLEHKMSVTLFSIFVEKNLPFGIKRVPVFFFYVSPKSKKKRKDFFF